ncbi:MAG TPA: kelch repeat-containing protein [Actinomycetota bacterium]
MKLLKRLLKRVLVVVAVLAVVFGAFIAYLGITTPGPREADVWVRLPDLPHPRGEMAAAVGARVADDECRPGEPCESSLTQLLVMGGLSGLGSTSDLVDVFDPGTGTWRDGPRLPEPRHHIGAAGTGGVIYVSGGAKTATDWTPEANFWELDPTETQWRVLPDMPEARMGHQMVALNNKLYVIGGRGTTSNVLVYDPIAGQWSIGAEMPEQRDHLVAATAGYLVYAIGGRDEEVTDRVDVYDVNTDSWSAGPPLPVPMSGMAVATLSDGIHVVGGEQPAVIGGHVVDRHFVLKPGGDEWTDAALPIVATHGSASAMVRGGLVIAGGARRQSAFSPLGWTGIVEVYDPANADD